MDCSSSISPPVLIVDIVTSRVQDGVSTITPFGRLELEAGAGVV